MLFGVLTSRHRSIGYDLNLMLILSNWFSNVSRSVLWRCKVTMEFLNLNLSRDISKGVQGEGVFSLVQNTLGCTVWVSVDEDEKSCAGSGDIFLNAATEGG